MDSDLSHCARPLEAISRMWNVSGDCSNSMWRKCLPLLAGYRWVGRSLTGWVARCRTGGVMDAHSAGCVMLVAGFMNRRLLVAVAGFRGQCVALAPEVFLQVHSAPGGAMD